ncbi:MAG: hypothetical protein H6897_15895 [Rhodobacteraceae bacterium]|uniref:hypothetical protein n=1 Tax=Albidovulum sp. TaxID=1872424 RepID=UPI001D331AEA|nr:hypothetical protein [uncultured Defluviimonas sp.]MCB2125944.1 hypothetical protein [Paracoccaceae bacterium]MCC0071398.1 hypothetical protein [Paracoccaceae bacterium]
MILRAALAAALVAATPVGAGPLDGKRYMIELTSSQYGSGYGEYLVPPLAAALAKAGLRTARQPPVDIIVNVVTGADVGRWVGTGASRQWLYTVTVTVGISPEAYVIPPDGTPAFGVRAKLVTPNPDREDELDCLIRLAARTAVANWRPTGMFGTDGSACRRR